MSDNTCFRLIISEPWPNVREYLHSFGLLFQVYIPKGSPNIVNVKYEEECSAIQAIAALANEKRVLSIEPLNQWPYVKKTEHSKSSLNSTSDSGDSSVIDIRRLITDALLCRKCGAPANYTCWVCGSWYCDEKCQQLDRSDHVMKCIPPLVRGMPGLNELLDRLEMMQKEKRQQESSQQQQQKAQQQLQQKAQQQQQQKQKVPQQQQQKVQPQEQQQQQNVSQQQQQQKVPTQQQQQQQQKVPTQQQQQQQALQQALQQQQQALQQALQQQQLLHKDQQQQQLMALQQLQQKAHQQAQQQAKQQHAQLQAQKQCLVDEQLRTGKENGGNNTEKHPPTNGANRTVQAKQQPDSLGANIVKPVMQETKKHEQGQMKEQPNGPKLGATQPGSSNRVDEQTVKKQSPQKTDATNVLLNGSGKVAPSPDKSKQQPAQQPAAPNVNNSRARSISGSFSLHKRMQSLALASTKRTIEYGPFPAVGSTVTISVVMDKTLYIREVCNDVNDPFTNYIIRCITHASEIEQQLQLPPAEGDIAFAPYEGNFYRAIVKKIEGDNAVVMFPDFGNSQRIQWKLLKEIRDTTIKYATCTTHCVSLFTEEPFPPAARAFLTDLVEVEPFEVTRVQANASPGETKVELRHLASKYLLSAKVREVANNAPARAKQTEPAAANAKKLVATDPATYKPVFCEELKENYFPDVGDEEVELIIVEASQFSETHFVSVILASNQRSFATVLKECSDYGTLDPNDYEGESESEYACLVKFDGTWSRAVKISGDANDSFFLLDFGIVQRRDKLDRICRFPPALSRQLYCSECMVDNPAILKGWIEKSGNSTFALSGLFVKAKLHVDEDTAILHMKIASITG